MTERDLRVLVREAIARHLHGQADGPGPAAAAHAGVVPVASVVRAPLSHAQFVLPAPDGSCVVEPAVSCNHCGFCKSYGH